jgi:hypothetical protein
VHICTTKSYACAVCHQVAVARLDWRRLLQPWQRASPFFADVAAATGGETMASAPTSTAVSAAIDLQQVISVTCFQ